MFKALLFFLPLGLPAQPFQLAPPQMLCDSVFFRASARIELAFSLEGAEIHYTLDGTAPTAESPLYRLPVVMPHDGRLRAVAVHPEYRSSDPVELRVWRTGLPPQEIALLPDPAPEYPGRGAGGLFDARVGSANLHDGNWLGFAGGTVQLTARYPEVRRLQRIVVNALSQPGAWIFPPRRIEVWGRRPGGRWRRLGAQQLKPENLNSSSESAFVLSFRPRRLTELRLEIESFGPLPAGHAGAGKPAWLFLDEIGVY